MLNSNYRNVNITIPSTYAQNFRLNCSRKLSPLPPTGFAIFFQVRNYFLKDYNNHYANGNGKRTRLTCEEKRVLDFPELMVKGGYCDIIHRLQISICKTRLQTETLFLSKGKSNRKTSSNRGAGWNWVEAFSRFKVPSNQKFTHHRVFIYQNSGRYNWERPWTEALECTQ